jgi:hypothetical protein
MYSVWRTNSSGTNKIACYNKVFIIKRHNVAKLAALLVWTNSQVKAIINNTRRVTLYSILNDDIVWFLIVFLIELLLFSPYYFIYQPLYKT